MASPKPKTSSRRREPKSCKSSRKKADCVAPCKWIVGKGCNEADVKTPTPKARAQKPKAAKAPKAKSARTLSGYEPIQLFSKDFMPEIMREHSDKTVTQRASILGEKWRNLKPETQQKYEKLANSPIRHFSFGVSIWNDENEIKKINAALMKRVVKWYQEQMPDIPMILGVNVVITNITNKGNKIYVELVVEDMDVLEDIMGTLVDPDGNGNYPLEIDGKFYLISGDEDEALKNVE